MAARRSRDRRSTSIDALRTELDNVGEVETLVPTSRRSLGGSRARGAANDDSGAETPRSPRASTTSMRRADLGHITFSDEVRSPARPNVRPDTSLYPIESRVEDTEAARRWREATNLQKQQQQQEVETGGEPRPSRVSFAEPPAVTRPRHFKTRFEGVEESIKRAAQANTTIADAKDWVARQSARTRRMGRTRTGKLRAMAAATYKRWVLEGLLRRRPLPPSANGRRIPLVPGLARRKDGLVDERRGRPYISNFIRSSRYTVWSFLPKQLFFQFSKLANAYFLTIGILQMIPGLSTTGTYTTIGPLIAFVALSMAKEGWDDYRRYRLDKLENRTDAWVLDPDGSLSGEVHHSRIREKLTRRRGNAGGELQELGETSERPDETPPWSQDEDVRWSKLQWQDIRVGDIIKLRRDDNVPADVILLHATGPNGIAYIETMALDGETNLKSKQACPLFTRHCKSLSGMRSCEAEAVSEDPNLDLYNFTGKAVVNGEAMPLTLNQVVYRGSTLRNTSEAVGLVINTGEECKIRMNASDNVHAKAPAMQAKVNKIIILLVVFVVLLSLGCSIGNILWVRHTQHIAWYLQDSIVAFGKILVGFIIAFNTLIPLSLYVSLEIVKIGQVMLLRDIDMYDPKSNTPMVANTTTILEDLGQVSYVFSDKTGTLTENLMRFRKMSVAGVALLHDMDVRRDTEERGRRREREESNATVMTAKRKGKQVQRSSVSTMHTYSTVSAPRRSSSVWTSTARPSQAQPQFRTDDLLQYIRQDPNTPFSKKARQFLLCIALCHTCLPEKKAGGKIEFQAASPDELALIEAAQDLGILLIDRPAQSIKLRLMSADDSWTEETYEVLDVIEFSSKRKRMSIVIRMPDGRVCVFSKGADSVILPRLKLSKLAMETADAVDRQASIRKSMEQGKAMRKMSVQSARNSTTFARRTSNLFGRKSTGKRSASMQRPSFVGADMEPRSQDWNMEMTGDANLEASISPRTSMSRGRSMDLLASTTVTADPYNGMVDESVAVSDSAVFERCFQHLDDFANEGLRTLLYAYRYVGEDEYREWKNVYLEASTSLVDRQERIEAAAELIERSFDLAGATAIEDKLQQGVPETIDMLRRANIKVWMLTGDKRETAINIAHSARICKPFSEIYVLDATEGSLQDKIAATLVDVGRGMIPHSVVVIDGHTLGIVEDDEALKVLLFDLVARVDSVICCRASPAQKATLVKCIRDRVPLSLTLAIGDGANDIAMIQSSHVGIGISGREGLQAARISDYSIAQFRFLQKLLFVHGRWNYIRTSKYILGTFWKETIFYLVQAFYQRYNGYTGTSLYESASLAVFNTLFTSLAVILPGIFEQDLRAETLLAMPELYTLGQKGKSFSFRKYLGWTTMGVLEAALVYFGIWGIFTHMVFDGDNGLYAMGDLAFSACVVLINFKLLVLELHHKTAVTAAGLLLSVAGWFLWNLFLSAIYKRRASPYAVRDGFVYGFGRVPAWWLTLVMVLAAVVVFELAVTALRRIYWPEDQDLMQEAEQIGRAVRGGDDAAEMGCCDADDDDGAGDEEDVVAAGGGGRAARFKNKLGRIQLPGILRKASSAGADTARSARRASTRLSATGDVYVAPPFVSTPVGERQVNPMDEAGDKHQNNKKKKGTSSSVTEVFPRSDAEENGGRSTAEPIMTGPVFVESPIELRSPDWTGS